MGNIDGIFEEYKTLRDEILKRQNARLIILGFVVAGIGTVLGILFKGASSAQFIVSALLLLVLILLISALVLTVQYTQHIELISAYIRTYIESKDVGLQWETKWTNYRSTKQDQKNLNVYDKISLGSSKPLAIFYAVLTFFSGIAVFIIANTITFLALTPCIIISFLLCNDLFHKKSPGWLIDVNYFESNRNNIKI